MTPCSVGVKCRGLVLRLCRGYCRGYVLRLLVDTTCRRCQHCQNNGQQQSKTHWLSLKQPLLFLLGCPLCRKDQMLLPPLLSPLQRNDRPLLSCCVSFFAIGLAFPVGVALLLPLPSLLLLPLLSPFKRSSFACRLCLLLCAFALIFSSSFLLCFAVAFALVNHARISFMGTRGQWYVLFRLEYFLSIRIRL